MSVRASCDTVTTSAHLAGGQTTTIAAREQFLLVRYMNSRDGANTIDVFYALCEWREKSLPCFRETAALQNYSHLFTLSVV